MILSNKVKHPLHKKIYSILEKELGNIGLLGDKACFIKANSNIPFFIKDNKSNATEITNVDILFYKKNNSGVNKVKLVCEIEESDRTPIRIFGKYYAAENSRYWKDPESKTGKLIPLNKDYYFLQILLDDYKSKSKKSMQFEFINQCLEKDLRKKYKIISGSLSEFDTRKKKERVLVDFLRNNIL